MNYVANNPGHIHVARPARPAMSPPKVDHASPPGAPPAAGPHFNAGPRTIRGVPVRAAKHALPDGAAGVPRRQSERALQAGPLPVLRPRSLAHGYELPSAFAYLMTALPTSWPIATPASESLRKWMPAHNRDAAFSLARLRK